MMNRMTSIDSLRLFSLVALVVSSIRFVYISSELFSMLDIAIILSAKADMIVALLDLTPLPVFVLVDSYSLDRHQVLASGQYSRCIYVLKPNICD